MIYGNTEGIKNSILDELENIYDIRVSKESICSKEIVEMLCRITTYLNRELSLAIDKRGVIVSISVGDSSNVNITEIEANQNKLCGIRIVHTHPNGDSRLSEIDISALVKLRLDCIAAIGVSNDDLTGITIGFCKVKDGEVISEISEKLTLDEAINFNIVKKVNEIEKSMNDEYVLKEEGERALLVGTDTEDSLDELKELAKACNVTALEKILQKRDTIDTAFYVGKGKVSEIALIAQLSGANIVIFDDELSGSQVRNLEENLGIKVIDRTTLILHIFASRARSKESKLQVELAQLKYRLARLAGLGIVLSRTGGGIGTRGPGEKKLETDRRHIREKIYEISKELKKIKQVRKTQRKKRDEINKVSLVGYTNSGKSTLRNKLCEVAVTRENINKEKVFEADMLFATLDTTTRAVELEDGRTIAVTDTVGFIKKLPHDLVEAFKSTLEEVQYADLLLHVVDASSDYAEEQIDAVNEVLSELEVNDKPILIVLNKIDKLEDSKLSSIKDKYKNSNPNAIFISARYGTNLNELLKKVLEMLPNSIKKAEYLIPYTEQSAVSFIHKHCKVKNEDYREDGTYVNALVDKKTYNKFKKFIINAK